MSVVPIRKALAPAAWSRAMSAVVLMPLSATLTMPSGISFSSRSDTAMSTASVSRSRLLTPMMSAPAATARAISSPDRVSTSASIPSARVRARSAASAASSR